ncbi:lipoprotein [Spiroplasma endosymbiont of Dioctria linearis]|uniref:lipoprotein n=1 Tax=Spiroplasma endosymbiont of Dioctria linearis TaxID=3066290 RepID=UPI00313BA674
MKKLLAVLGSITLVTSSSFTVVSCFGGTTDPEKEKTNWSDEEILERFGSLEVNELENGDLELSSKDDHFKIWSGSNNGNKYERIVKKDDVDNNNVNFLYDSLLPTDASLEKPFGIELMSGFYVGKSEDEVKKAFSNVYNNIQIEFGSEMTNDNHWNLKKKNAFSIFLGSGHISGNTFSCTRIWEDVLKIKTDQGEDIYIGLISLYIDYFVGYVTSNLSTWMKEFFEEYSSQLNSPDLLIEEVVNEKGKIIANSKNQHLNLKLYNANFTFKQKIDYKQDEETEVRNTEIEYALNSYIKSKVSYHTSEFNYKYENSSYKDFYFDHIIDLEDPNKDRENHYNRGFEIWGPNNKSWDYNSIIYTKMDIINN